MAVNLVLQLVMLAQNTQSVGKYNQPLRLAKLSGLDSKAT